MKFIKTIDADTKIEDIELTDYPYLGIGKKPSQKNKYATEDELEKIISG